MLGVSLGAVLYSVVIPMHSPHLLELGYSISEGSAILKLQVPLKDRGLPSLTLAGSLTDFTTLSPLTLAALPQNRTHWFPLQPEFKQV